MHSQNQSGAQNVFQNTFGGNFQQIHRANNLLKSIETQLTDFFQKDPPIPIHREVSPLDIHDTNDTASMTSNLLERGRNRPKLGVKVETPSENKDFLQYLSPLDDFQPHLSSLKLSEGIKSPNAADYLPTITNSLPDKELGLTKRKSDLQSQQEKGDHYDYILTESENWKVPQRNVQDMRGVLNGYDIVDKMNQMEEFYKHKIKLLEDRFQHSESEVLGLKKIHQTFEAELNRLRLDAQHWKNSAETNAESARRSEKYKKEIERLQEENERTRKEFEELRSKYERGQAEKRELEQQYNQLMKVHNEIIELDMQKNEQSLREVQDIEELTSLAGSLGSYKNEIEFLKVSNDLTQKQLKDEIQKLKESLMVVNEENKILKKGTSHKKSKASKIYLNSELYSSVKKKPREEKSNQKAKRLETSAGKQDFERTSQKNVERNKRPRALHESYVTYDSNRQEDINRSSNVQAELRILREKSRDEWEKLNDTYVEVFEGNKNVNTSYLESNQDMRREYCSASHARRASKASLERRQKMRFALYKDLEEVSIIDRCAKVAGVLNSREKNRSKSKSLLNGNQAGEEPQKSQSSLTAMKSNGEFENEVKVLKEMVNQRLSLKKVKPRNRVVDIGGSDTKDRYGNLNFDSSQIPRQRNVAW